MINEQNKCFGKVTKQGTIASKQELNWHIKRSLSNSKYNRINIKNVLDLVKPNKNDNILDFGCEIGHFLCIFSKKGCTVTGIDINETALKIGKEYCKKSGIKNPILLSNKNKSVSEMFPKNSFNKIVLNDSIEHIPKEKIKEIFGQFKEILNHKGEIFIYTPNKDYWFECLRRFFKKENPSHIALYSEKELKELLVSEGYTINFFEKRASNFFDFIEIYIPFNFAKKRLLCGAIKKETRIGRENKWV